MFTIGEIAKILNGEIINCNADSNIAGISTDSRENLNGKLFIPLIGKNFNGHDFIHQAIKKGACVALTSENRKYNEELPLIKVRDTLKSLWEIAKYYILKNKLKVIAITGTCGKTTTKDILKHITGFYGTEKNYNNLIGVPLTVLNADKNSGNIIVELGINVEGEMKILKEITTPEYVIITNIGYGHLEGLLSINKVFEEKTLLIKENKDLIKGFINDKIDYRGENILTFGKSEKANCKLIKSDSSLMINYIEFSYKNKKYSLKSKLLGEYNALNIIAAFALSKELGFEDDFIIERIESFIPENKRSEIIKTDKNYSILNDCYNANFDSFNEAIKLFNSIKVEGKKIAVIGDMFELGKYSKNLHEKIGYLLSSSNIDYVIATGKMIKYALEKINGSKKVKYFSSKEEIIDFLNSILCSGDLVLIKASRGMKFETITEGLL